MVTLIYYQGVAGISNVKNGYRHTAGQIIELCESQWSAINTLRS